VPKRWHDAPGSERAQDAAQAGNGGRQAHCERAESDHMHQEHDDERPETGEREVRGRTAGASLPVISYISARVPGLGSAIFLHVGTGTTTAGCVSLPERELLDVLRWFRPGRSLRIEIRAR
jgi:L,D-peptidoglycan transpeptidase YkuD (ErfK/YbiS/YcfS/YnhG family)